MKGIPLIILTCFYLTSFAQIENGFKKEEVRDMIAICNSYTFLELFNSDSIIIPKGYKRYYTSPVLGMDNMYQIYINNKTAVINFRGSTSNKISWLENVYSAMIPAKGKIEIAGKTVKYCFAKDQNAGVHAGYSLAIAFLYDDIIHQIKALNRKGIYSFIITGHSQGGALANLTRAYLENLSRWKLRKRNEFKTYAFAAPMVGNKEFMEEYNSKYSDCGSSFNIVNPSDPIPKLPLSYLDSNYVSNNLKSFLFDNESFSLNKMILDGVSLIVEKNTNSLSRSVAKQIAKEVGPFSMPAYLKEINYYSLNNKIEIQPYILNRLLELKSPLKNRILKSLFPNAVDDPRFDNLQSKKGSLAYHHKPYTYYISYLKEHFPQEYELLQIKLLSGTNIK